MKETIVGRPKTEPRAPQSPKNIGQGRARKQSIAVAPVGTVEQPLLRHLASDIAEIIPLDICISEGIPIPPDSINRRRRQYLSLVVLDELKRCKSGNSMALGIIDADIYVPPLNFVFGMANPDTGTALVSVARLREEFFGRPADKGLLRVRMAKEALHEIGHMLSLDHCRTSYCIMRFSNHLAETDSKKIEFCAACSELIDDAVLSDPVDLSRGEARRGAEPMKSSEDGNGGIGKSEK